ncbi:MAG: tRNA (guanosine(46)-N7)-methyltransferase TrmB [Chitinophagia bacterium]|nr:tRNA (guanosine(46)-N7)-methyltransferase TrmB [Chitinophagia bacterium]
MGHKKLVKFQAIDTYKNVLQYPEDMRGKWAAFFENDNPITLELACGKGEYSVNLGRAHKDRNFIGVDIKGNRIYNGAKKALNEHLNNVAFLRVHIGQITQYFERNEVSEIWIVFSDPFIKKGKEKNRLTHSRFLAAYQHIMKPGGIIHLKTDSPVLYEFTLETIAEQGCNIIENIPDIYGNNKATGPLAIQTYYESLHLADGRKIYYVSFTLPSHPIVMPERFQKFAESEGND